MQRELRQASPREADGKKQPKSWHVKTVLRVTVVCLVVSVVLVQCGRSSLGFVGASVAAKKKRNDAGAPRVRGDPLVYDYRIVARYPHDPMAFTQGLVFEKLCETTYPMPCVDVFVESTGLYGRSTVRRVEVKTGKILNKTELSSEYFGEGLTKFGKRYYQLTWLTPTTFVYDTNLKKVAEKATPLKDGWGLTADDEVLIATDSGSYLHWIDRRTFELYRSVQVTDGGRPIHLLNEVDLSPLLEWISGKIWSNIWQKNCIAIIEPTDGVVEGWLRLPELRAEALKVAKSMNVRIDVLNGIAYDEVNNRIFVTGKLWPLVFEIELLEGRQVSEKELQQVRETCIPSEA